MNSNISVAAKYGAENYPNSVKKQLEYGTAGFRDHSSVLPHVMYRMGLLAVLRSKLQNGDFIGVMVTASHNPEEDNGVKLCDPMGNMLEADWEVLATQLANAKDEHLQETLQHICDTNSINASIPANVFLGRDTRSSSPSLAEAVANGVKVLQGELKDFGIVTTPILHYLVYYKNTHPEVDVTACHYYEKLSSAFSALNSEKPTKHYTPLIYVDCANGVGAYALRKLIPLLVDTLNIQIFNAGSLNLNHRCGADYVKVQQIIPDGSEIVPGKRYASLDGDADRLIYFYIDQNRQFHMLDGDKIAALFVLYLMELVKKSGLSLKLKVVQTAYANGNSTNYIEKTLGIPTVCVPTGVKHLHHEAMKYDIGIYFEANGHGTVVFGKTAKEQIFEIAHGAGATDEQAASCRKLLHAINLINETVGDAISDLLLVETILRDYDWDIVDWDKLYSDLSCRQLKVKVADRRLIITTDAGRVCVSPHGLQGAINDLVALHQTARAFVRPSGTENIIRVYAEAETQEAADSLAKKIADQVIQFTTT